MKKFIAIILATAMLFTLAACGENGGSSSDDGERRAGEGEGIDQNTPDNPADPPTGNTPAPDTNAPVDPNERGNTVGNTKNGGWAAISGDWIYYVGYNDGMQALHKMRTDGSDRQMIEVSGGSLMPNGINVVGDMIYFVSGFNLYKVSTNGGYPEDIGDNLRVERFTVIGDMIYCKAATPEDFNHYDIVVLRADGSEQWQLDIGGDSICDFNVYEDRIYYTVNDGALYYLHSIKTDGTDAQVLINDTDVRGICVDGDRIYYLGGDDLWSVKTDGTDRQIVCDDNAQWLNVADGVIYYETLSGDQGALHSIRTDGTDRQTLYDGSVSGFNVVGDLIVYYDASEHPNIKLYMLRTDGTGREVLSERGGN